MNLNSDFDKRHSSRLPVMHAMEGLSSCSIRHDVHSRFRTGVSTQHQSVEASCVRVGNALASVVIPEPDNSRVSDRQEHPTTPRLASGVSSDARHCGVARLDGFNRALTRSACPVWWHDWDPTVIPAGSMEFLNVFLDNAAISALSTLASRRGESFYTKHSAQFTNDLL